MRAKCRFLAHRVIPRRRSNSVAFGLKRTSAGFYECTATHSSSRTPLFLSYTPMSAPALSKFDRIAVRVMKPHRPLPRFLVGRFGELHPPIFQLFVKCIEVIGR